MTNDNTYKSPQGTSQARKRTPSEKDDYLPTLVLFLGAAISFVIAAVDKSGLLLTAGLGLAIASIASIFTGKR
jgi:hypothetical protein